MDDKMKAACGEIRKKWKFHLYNMGTDRTTAHYKFHFKALTALLDSATLPTDNSQVEVPQQRKKYVLEYAFHSDTRYTAVSTPGGLQTRYPESEGDEELQETEDNEMQQEEQASESVSISAVKDALSQSGQSLPVPQLDGAGDEKTQEIDECKIKKEDQERIPESVSTPTRNTAIHGAGRPLPISQFDGTGDEQLQKTEGPKTPEPKDAESKSDKDAQKHQERGEVLPPTQPVQQTGPVANDSLVQARKASQKSNKAETTKFATEVEKTKLGNPKEDSPMEDSPKIDGTKKTSSSGDEESQRTPDQVQPTVVPIGSNSITFTSQQSADIQDCEANAAYLSSKIRADLSASASPRTPASVTQKAKGTATDGKPDPANIMATADSDTDMDLTPSSRYSSQKKHKRASTKLDDSDSDVPLVVSKKRKLTTPAMPRAGEALDETPTKDVTKGNSKQVAANEDEVANEPELPGPVDESMDKDPIAPEQATEEQSLVLGSSEGCVVCFDSVEDPCLKCRNWLVWQKRAMESIDWNMIARALRPAAPAENVTDEWPPPGSLVYKVVGCLKIFAFEVTEVQNLEMRYVEVGEDWPCYSRCPTDKLVYDIVGILKITAKHNKQPPFRSQVDIPFTPSWHLWLWELNQTEADDVWNSVIRLGMHWYAMAPITSTESTEFLSRRGVRLNMLRWGRYDLIPTEFEDQYLSLLYEDRFIVLNNPDFLVYLSQRTNLSYRFFLYLASYPFGHYYRHADGTYETRDYMSRSPIQLPPRPNEGLNPAEWVDYRFTLLNQVDFFLGPLDLPTNDNMTAFWKLLAAAGGIGHVLSIKKKESRGRKRQKADHERRWPTYYPPLGRGDPAHPWKSYGPRLRASRDTPVRSRSVGW